MGYDGGDVGAVPGVVSLSSWHTPGSIVTYEDTDGSGPQGGTKMSWIHDGILDTVKYVYGVMRFPAAIGDGRILHYSLTSRSNDNGYMLMARKNVPDFVQAMQGNVDFVQQSVRWGTLQTTFSDPWEVGSVPQIAMFCGGTVDYIGGDADHAFLAGSDGMTALPAFRITPTPPPTSRIDLNQTTYTVGDKIPVGLHGEVFAAATAWHQSAVRVYNTSGVNKYFAVDGYAPAHGITWDGGGLTPIRGGGSGDPNRPNVYDETATLDTSGMAPGPYTIEYTLFDNVARASSSSTDGSGSVMKQITLQPAPANGGGGAQPTDPTPTPTDQQKQVLTMKFVGLPQSVPMGSMFDAHVEISNNGDEPVTTPVTFNLIGGMHQGHYEYEYYECGTSDQPKTCRSRYEVWGNFPLRGTITQTVTIPAHGVYNWTVADGLSWQVIGGQPSSFTRHLWAGGKGNNGVYDTSAKYFPTLKATATEPGWWLTPTITANIGTNFDVPEKPLPILVQ